MTLRLFEGYPQLARHLRAVALAELPTPVEARTLRLGNRDVSIAIKHDDVSGRPYGGNKVRKLEYLLRRAQDRGATRVATFGTVASNHALATAVYARELGLGCLCFLSHQRKTAKAADVLDTLLSLGAVIIRFGGRRAERIATLREHLPGQKTWVIPPGGSNWLGAAGFVNAGLELAAQCRAGELQVPDRVYVANGTMGTAAGLALGLALTGLPTEVHAVRVTHDFVASPAGMQRLLRKTTAMLRRLDDSLPENLADRVRLQFRDGYFAGGYAHTDAATEAAIDCARSQLGLELEATYTGKAMAALLADARQPELEGQSLLFWNTYNSRKFPAGGGRPAYASGLPAEFRRYFD